MRSLIVASLVALTVTTAASAKLSVGQGSAGTSFVTMDHMNPTCRRPKEHSNLALSTADSKCKQFDDKRDLCGDQAGCAWCPTAGDQYPNKGTCFGKGRMCCTSTNQTLIPSVCEGDGQCCKPKSSSSAKIGCCSKGSQCCDGTSSSTCCPLDGVCCRANGEHPYCCNKGETCSSKGDQKCVPSTNKTAFYTRSTFFDVGCKVYQRAWNNTFPSGECIAHEYNDDMSYRATCNRSGLYVDYYRTEKLSSTPNCETVPFRHLYVALDVCHTSIYYHCSYGDEPRNKKN